MSKLDIVVTSLHMIALITDNIRVPVRAVSKILRTSLRTLLSTTREPLTSSEG